MKSYAAEMLTRKMRVIALTSLSGVTAETKWRYKMNGFDALQRHPKLRGSQLCF